MLFVAAAGTGAHDDVTRFVVPSISQPVSAIGHQRKMKPVSLDDM